eukprot:6465050-Amphidinium_carterae.1
MGVLQSVMVVVPVSVQVLLRLLSGSAGKTFAERIREMKEAVADCSWSDDGWCLMVALAQGLGGHVCSGEQ